MSDVVFANTTSHSSNEGIGVRWFSQHAGNIAFVDAAGITTDNHDGNAPRQSLSGHLTMNVATVQAWQSEVENDCRRRARFQEPQRIDSVFHREDGVPRRHKG